MSTAPPAERERLITPRFALVVTVGLGYFLGIGMLLPTVPLLVKHRYGGSDLNIGLAVGAFAVGAVVLRPFAGRLGDRLGRRVLIVGGALIFGLSVTAYHAVGSIPQLVVIRLLGGIGEAAFFVGAGTMITDLSPAHRRGEAMSYWSVAIYGGLAFGPFLGELTLGDDDFGRVWTACAALALGAAFLGLFTRETLAIDRNQTVAKMPLLHRSALAPGLILFLGLVGLAGFTEFLTLYVQEIGMAESRAVFLTYGVTVLAVRIFGATIPDRFGPLRTASAATLGSAAGLLLMAAVPRPLGLFAATVVFAMGMSLLFPAMITLALTGVPDNERGSAIGTIASFFDAAQGLGAAALGGVAALSGYRGAFVAGAALSLLSFALLRGGLDPRARLPVDHEAAAAAGGAHTELS